MATTIYRNRWWNVGPVKVVIADVPYSLPAAQWELPPSSTVQIVAYPTGMAWTYDTTPPYPGEGVSLFIITTDATKIIGWLNTQTAGGSGGNNLLSPSSVFNGFNGTTITLTAEGVAQVKATVTVNLQQAGFTPDQSIRSYELSWAIAGTNQWHPGATIAYAPNAYTVTGYIHGLAGGQSYDVAFQARAHDGTATPSSPILVTAASPSITGASITQVLAAGSVSWKQLHGDTSGDTSTPIVDGSNKRLLHAAMSAGVQSVINSSGQIPASTPLKTNLPNTIPWRSNTKLWVAWISGQNLTYWIDDGSGNGGNPSIWLPDGTTVAGVVNIGGNGFNARTNGIVVSGSSTWSSAYFCVYFLPGSVGGFQGTGWYITVQSTQFGANDPSIAAAYQDGGYTAIFATINTTDQFNAGSSGGSSGGGHFLM